MSINKLCKGKHLRIEERLIIEYGLDQHYTLKEIKCCEKILYNFLDKNTSLLETLICIEKLSTRLERNIQLP